MEDLVSSTATQNKTGDRKIFIVRHSERLDEANEKKWHAISTKLVRTKGYREEKDVLADPPITDRGKEIAKEACSTLMRTGIFSSQRAIFTSRLIRSVETAIVIARLLKLPLHISRGISSSAAAVRKAQKAGRQYTFESIEDLRALAPDVQMFCCDAGYDEDGKKSKEDRSLPRTNNKEWVAALKDIIEYENFAIIVAHRETIRNLANERLPTQYCCISEFKYWGDRFNFEKMHL